MKTFRAAALAAAMLLSLPPATVALAADAPKAVAKGPAATVRQMMDSFNKGDATAFNAF